MKIRKWLTTLVVGILAAGGLTLGVAAPASATYNSIDCSTASLTPHRDLDNGDHINIDISQNGRKFQANAYVDKNVAGGYKGLGVRVQVDGATKGPFPLTKSEVQDGVLVFSYGQYLTGRYTVEWAQFNSTYFNQNRDPKRFLTCGKDPEPTKDATADIVTTPATCEANGTATWSNLTHATGSVLDQTPGAHTGTATSTQGHVFTDGKNTLTKAYEIEVQLDPNEPPCWTKPPQPADKTGTDKGQDAPVCVPAQDGNAIITSWTRDWTQPSVWDDEKREWVDGEKIYAEKIYTTGETFPSENCAPVTRDPKETVDKGEWTGGEPTCKDQEVTQTRTVTITTQTWSWEFQDGKWVELTASSERQGEPETRTLTWEGEDCPTPTPTPTPTPDVTPTPTPTPDVTPTPTPTPDVTPTPTPTATSTPAAVPPTDDELPRTGSEPLNPWIPTLGALGVAMGTGLVIWAWLMRRRRAA